MAPATAAGERPVTFAAWQRGAEGGEDSIGAADEGAAPAAEDTAPTAKATVPKATAQGKDSGKGMAPATAAGERPAVTFAARQPPKDRVFIQLRTTP